MSRSGLFVPYHQMRSAGHPFYQALDTILRDAGFDKYAEKLCSRFYHPVTGRPGLAPGNYFRSLLVGYFEGIDSERGIAWRLADSLSLRDFLGLPTEKAPPDHSTISRTRRLIDEETHQEIFAWVLGLLSKNDLLKGSGGTGGCAVGQAREQRAAVIVVSALLVAFAAGRRRRRARS
jgi:transposase